MKLHDHTLWHRLWAEGAFDAEIARKTGAAPSTVAYWRNRRGLKANDARSLAPGQERARQRLYAAGLTDSEIARRLGISITAVGFWRLRRGLAKNTRKDGRA